MPAPLTFRRSWLQLVAFVGSTFEAVGVSLHECLAELLLERVVVHTLRYHRLAVGVVIRRVELLPAGRISLALIEAGGVALAGDHVGGAVLGIGRGVSPRGIPIATVRFRVGLRGRRCSPVACCGCLPLV